jgi:beta-phosphoglucomutase-like phosphatase (HAD superfamily)
MGLAGGNRPHPRALIFDLDRCLIDSRPAWRYCIEESLAAGFGRRENVAELVEEYHFRPWRDALAVLLASREDAARCEELCVAMFERSAMKRLLVHEGIGMALDRIRGERIEIGAISRLPHRLAVKQVQSTGLDRFVEVLSATPEREPWAPTERFAGCVGFLEAPAAECGFVSGEPFDLAAVETTGARPYLAAWGGGEGGVELPGDLLAVVLRDWARR